MDKKSLGAGWDDPEVLADRAGLVNVARHDPDLGLARSHDARAVRADEPRCCAPLRDVAHVRLLQEIMGANHVIDRNAFGDADDQLDSCLG